MKGKINLILLTGILAIAGFKIWSRLHIPELPIGQTSIFKADGRALQTGPSGKKFLLISCFQSWCGDCIREAPSIQALQDSLGEDKLEVWMLSDEDWEKINRFAFLSKTSLPFYRTEKSFSDLGIRVYPSTWLLDPDRNILMAKLEGFDWNSAEVHTLIQHEKK